MSNGCTLLLVHHVEELAALCPVLRIELELGGDIQICATSHLLLPMQSARLSTINCSKNACLYLLFQSFLVLSILAH